VVAEQFALLEALHPGRIDLGIGRAPGTDGATAQALRRHTDAMSIEDFPLHVLETMAMLGDVRPELIEALGPRSGSPCWPITTGRIGLGRNNCWRPPKRG